MKSIRVALIALTFTSITLSTGTSASDEHGAFGTTVRTEQGAVQGFRIADFATVAWQGIPYARPPVGNLRWKAPMPPGHWNGVRAATSYGSPCSQGSSRGSEDCLYLNVWRPDSGADHLPVLVFIHGGSNIGGSGEGSWYTAAHSYNVVVVTLNYRLGPMGWFSHPALKTGDRKDDSGNFGTLDQIAALQWVHDNIARFGGDPGNVTLAGQSAGSQNVSYLMHTRLAKDLFQKAFIESNFPGIRPVSAAYKSSKQVLYNLLVADGIAPTADAAKAYVAAKMSDQDIRNYFYGKSPKDIRKAYSNGWWGSINWGDFYRDDIIAGSDYTAPPLVQASQDRPEFVYSIGDGYVLPNDITFANFTKGHVYPKPMMVGTVRNENNAWNAYWPFNFQEGKPLNDLVAEAVNGTNADYGYLQTFFDAYGKGNADTFKSNYKFGTQLIDEVDRYIGAEMSARNMAAIESADDLPIYVYRFDWGSNTAKNNGIPFEDAWKFYVGAPHSADLDFWYQKFGGLTAADGGTATAYQYTAANLPGRQALASAMGSYFHGFLHDREGRIEKRKGQPINWAPWTADRPRYIVFDGDRTTPDVRMSATDFARSPSQLFAAHAAHPDSAVRDFVEYYVLWSWHWNWYPNSSVGPFVTSPGPNLVFDPNNP